MCSVITRRILIVVNNSNPLKRRLHWREFSTEEPEQKSLSYQESPSSEVPKTKILKVAVIGVPNAGKSTFINNLINHRVCPISNKVHTTRSANRAVYTSNNTQLILYDTPGLVTEREIKKHHLESSFSSAYKHSIQHGNIIGVIHDISNTWARHELHPTVLNTLISYPTFPSFLVLNKIDCLKSKRVLLDLVKKLTNNALTLGKKKKSSKIKSDFKEEGFFNPEDKKLVGWSNFSEVFMVSSLTGSGLPDVLNFLLNNARAGDWEFPSHVHTDQSPEDLVVDSVRARLLDYLPQEIPYTLKSQLEYYSEENGVIYASVQITCPNPRIEKLICGVSNGKLKQITERVTSDLVQTFGKPISLTITTSIGKKCEKVVL